MNKEEAIWLEYIKREIEIIRGLLIRLTEEMKRKKIIKNRGIK